jgi:cytochrome c oxidase assembly protein subunit 11
MEHATKKNRKTLIILIIITIAMFGFGFALVPFYNLLCKNLGINGKTSNIIEVNKEAVDANRIITVQFTATSNANLPWDFYPMVKEIKVHPGENEKIAYYAKNNSNHTMTVQAIPSVTPGLAAKYLKKTECFCFTQQTFQAGEGREMPLLFHLDKSLPKDIKILTLSYTMFDAENFKKASANKTQGKIS